MSEYDEVIDSGADPIDVGAWADVSARADVVDASVVVDADVVDADLVDAPVVVDADDLARERDEARAQATGYLDDLQRLQAEFENYRKRVTKEQSALFERAAGAVIERLLPVLDNFELALTAADRTKDYASMVKGVELVFSELLGILHKEGLSRMECLDKPFDPEQHEAVMHVEGEDGGAGGDLVVVDEMRSGYVLGGRVIRPAMVKVATR